MAEQPGAEPANRWKAGHDAAEGLEHVWEAQDDHMVQHIRCTCLMVLCLLEDVCPLVHLSHPFTTKTKTQAAFAESRQNGPFYAALGFSQGANVAAALLAKQVP